MLFQSVDEYSHSGVLCHERIKKLRINTSKVLKGQTEDESEIDGLMSQSVFLSLIPFKIESTQNT